MILVLLLPGWLFQRMVGFQMEGVGPFFAALFIGVWVGFLGSVFGGLGVRRLQGPAPDRRGRAWAVLSTAGARALLMVVTGALGSVVLGRGGEDGGDSEFLLPRWIAGFAATLLLATTYLRARIRAARRVRRGRGWWVFGGGMLLHLLLIAALPVSWFQAFVTFRPEVVRGGGQNRRYEGPKEPGLYAQRDLRLNLPERTRATLVLRRWDAGTPKELDRREVIGGAPVPVEVRLFEEPSKDKALSLRWSQPAKASETTWPLALPPKSDLIPLVEPRSIRLGVGLKTNLWLFQDFDQVLPLPSSARPDHAVELLVETAPAP